MSLLRRYKVKEKGGLKESLELKHKFIREWWSNQVWLAKKREVKAHDDSYLVICVVVC